MAKPGLKAILLPLALLHSGIGYELYTSKVFDIIGTDAVNDVFRVYKEKAGKLPIASIPALNREFVDPPLQGKKVVINAHQGTMQGTIKLSKNTTAHMSFDSIRNIIYANFHITIHDMKIAFKSFGIKFGHLSDQGSVVMIPNSSDFEVTMAVQHTQKPTRRCFTTMLKTKTIDMKDFQTTSSGFGSSDIDRDIGNIINKLMQKEVLGRYMDGVLKAYAEQTAPHVFIYCKYIPL